MSKPISLILKADKDVWVDKLLELVQQLPQEKQTAWLDLANFARTSNASKPNKKWLKQAENYLQAVGIDDFNQILINALKYINTPNNREPVFDEYGFFDGGNPLLFDRFNAITLKGLLWCILVSDPTGDTLAHTVAKVANASLKKVAGVGVKEIKLANTSVFVLSQMTNESALSALAFLDTTVTFKTTSKEIKKALNAVADRLGMSLDDLLEIGVPTFGLTAVGERDETWGETQVRLAVDDNGSHLSFTKNGKALKSAPADVKANFADELKELKAHAKDIDKNLTAIATRLDKLMISQKTWQGKAWQERYLNHVLTGVVARRLVWVVDGVACFFDDGAMKDIDEKVVNIQDDSEVRLFHPIDFEVADVLAWRNHLFEKGVKQPFKQVWREIYVLTDAERKTDFYSNRFAGHILKQHQFNQLAQLRGWTNRLRLSVDDSYEAPYRNLDEYGLRAEYWVEGIGGEWGVDLAESGAYLRLATDQLRFYPIDSLINSAHASGGGYSVNWRAPAPNGISLDQIPPKALSEIMRDVDLFVGVTSIGNDPNWADGGENGAFREYWQEYGFGDLSQSAKSRAEYLALIIPRLKIADKLTIEGKFLIVQGKVRSYKIHLGSSNILMLPNDEYLCIIPSNKKTTDVNLDFSGDRIFSLILSKAMLLADDDKITDVVILNQIHRK